MSQLTAVLDALQALCAQGQVMVDLFVNYDCDLQAANLFERSMKGLSKLLRRAPTTAPFSSPQAAKARKVALEAVLSILKTLDKWADPLKVSYTPGSGLLFSLSGNICRQCKAKLNNAWKQYNNCFYIGEVCYCSVEIVWLSCAFWLLCRLPPSRSQINHQYIAFCSLCLAVQCVRPHLKVPHCTVALFQKVAKARQHGLEVVFHIHKVFQQMG